jgi:hypothetical protein
MARQGWSPRQRGHADWRRRLRPTGRGVRLGRRVPPVAAAGAGGRAAGLFRRRGRDLGRRKRLFAERIPRRRCRRNCAGGHGRCHRRVSGAVARIAQHQKDTRHDHRDDSSDEDEDQHPLRPVPRPHRGLERQRAGRRRPLLSATGLVPRNVHHRGWLGPWHLADRGNWSGARRVAATPGLLPVTPPVVRVPISTYVRVRRRVPTQCIEGLIAKHRHLQ